MTATDSRIAHRSAEANAAWLTFWIGLGLAIRAGWNRMRQCQKCYGAGTVTVLDKWACDGDTYIRGRCSACKGTGKR